MNVVLGCQVRETVLLKTSSPFWEDNREDEGEVCALIRIIETVFTIYDVGWLGWILQKKIVLK